jgi:hypothetical protein
VIIDYVIPVPDARQWSVHHHPPSDLVAVLSGKCITDHVADIVCDERHLSIEAKSLEHGRDVPSFAFLVVALVGVR